MSEKDTVAFKGDQTRCWWIFVDLGVDIVQWRGFSMGPSEAKFYHVGFLIVARAGIKSYSNSQLFMAVPFP